MMQRQRIYGEKTGMNATQLGCWIRRLFIQVPNMDEGFCGSDLCERLVGILLDVFGVA